MMKKYLLMAIAMMMLSMTTYATEKSDRKSFRLSSEKMTELRVQAITKRLMLGDEAKSKFIPLYKQFQQELADLRKGCRPEKKEDLTDKEIDEQFKRYIETNRQLIAIKDKYYSHFREFLTARQAKTIINFDHFRATQKAQRDKARRGHPFSRHGSHPQIAKEK